MSEEYASKMAAAPFDRSDTDFIMRTSDGVEFRVHRLILSMASSMFEGMFSIPKPSALLSDPNIPDISITEDSETIDLYLRICYPLIDPEVPTLLLLRKVVTAGFKYDAPIVVHATCWEVGHSWQGRSMRNWESLYVMGNLCTQL